MNQPRVWSGQFAVVYKGVDVQGKAWALRAFTSESRSRREHYDCITQHLRACRLACLVDFEYHEAGIRSAGDGKWYPLVVMDWVEGMTLFHWVASKCQAGKGQSLSKAVQHWVRLVQDLSGAQIAHGDLQHANVLVTPQGYLKLVDYDGMCVPALAGRTNLELGVKPYQHPQRDQQTLLSEQLDRFSALLIYVALRALAADTTLWARHVEQTEYDKLLFRSEDLRPEEETPLYRDLRSSPDHGVGWLVERLRSLAAGAMLEVPPLAQVLAEVDPPAVARPPQQGRSSPVQPVELPAISWRVMLETQADSAPPRRLIVDRPSVVYCGRDPACQLRIVKDQRVSRRHFRLEISPPHVRLYDLGSRNGTEVNGVSYRSNSANAPGVVPQRSPTAVALRHGDRVVVGQTTIRVCIEQSVAASRG